MVPALDNRLSETNPLFKAKRKLDRRQWPLPGLENRPASLAAVEAMTEEEERHKQGPKESGEASLGFF